MSHKKDCIVVIPVYKALNDIDKASIRQAINMTQGTDITFIMPKSFSIDDSFDEFLHIGIERFDDLYFANILGYNKLMLDINFYKRFINYKYMLIHQTDVFLFKSELQYWCSKDYDYIGAPWLYPKKIIKKTLHNFILSKCPWILSHRRIRQIEHYNNVGNGGLSLRKIDVFIKIIEADNTNKTLNIYLTIQKRGDHIYNEDMFWSLEAPRLYENFKKPNWKEAMYFSLEKDPSYAYNHLMNKQLPFGCHAPLKIEYDFWKEHLPLNKPK